MSNLAFTMFDHNVGLSEIILIILAVFVIFLVIRNIGLKNKPK
ncbi:hypothetical protein ACVWYN_002969 [Pedobacter sp. UYP24]